LGRHGWRRGDSLTEENEVMAERFTEHLRQKAAGTWEGHIGTRSCGDWRWNACKRRAIRCSTRKSSAAAKPASVSAARTPWEVAIIVVTECREGG